MKETEGDTEIEAITIHLQLCTFITNCSSCFTTSKPEELQEWSKNIYSIQLKNHPWFKSGWFTRGKLRLSREQLLVFFQISN